jgi:hypothetical protein
MICTKQPFTKEQAEAALKRAKKGKQWRKEIRAYPCPMCKQKWHLTSREAGMKIMDVQLSFTDKWNELLSS